MKLHALRFLAWLSLATLFSASAHAADGSAWAYFGTYTNAKSEGIYVAEFNTAKGTFGEPRLAAKATSPSFLAITPDKKFLYAVAEISDFEGKKSGGILAYAIDAASGDLKPLNQKSSVGTGPCHVCVDRNGKHVLAANYGGGSVVAYAVEADGSLGKQTAFVQHTGSGPDPSRQKGPHAHSINIDLGNRFAFAADLGLDKVLIYKFNAADGSLTPNDPPSGSGPKGGGPRHFAVHPNGKFAYTNNEMLSSVTAFAWDAEKGSLTELHTLSTLPEGFSGNNSTAEIVVHPNGKFVLVSNRGHNSVAVFAVDEKTGKLTAAGHAEKGIKTPRNFALDPSGDFLVVCNQDGHTAIVFQFDAATGKTTPTEVSIPVGNPVCVRFLMR